MNVSIRVKGKEGAGMHNHPQTEWRRTDRWPSMRKRRESALTPFREAYVAITFSIRVDRFTCHGVKRESG